jgi:hypothetical protein
LVVEDLLGLEFSHGWFPLVDSLIIQHREEKTRVCYIS